MLLYDELNSGYKASEGARPRDKFRKRKKKKRTTPLI